jgi:hypothetical protein
VTPLGKVLNDLDALKGLGDRTRVRLERA